MCKPLLDAITNRVIIMTNLFLCAGSGKTYTMSGREEVIGADGYQGDSSDGIMTRAVHYLYQQASLTTCASCLPACP